MRYIATLLLTFTIFLSFSQKTEKYENLEARSGSMYLKGDTEPFTGKCYTTHENGKLGMGGYYVNGKMNGDWIWWYTNGKKKRYTQYKNGVKHGKSIYYYKNGVKKSEIIYDNNHNIRQISYDKKGKKKSNPSMSKFR